MLRNCDLKVFDVWHFNIEKEEATAHLTIKLASKHVLKASEHML